MISCLRDDRLVPPPSGDREVVQAGDAEGGLGDAITLRMPITNDLPRFMRQRCAQRGYGRCGGRRCALHVTVAAGLLLKGTSTEILEISMGSRDEAFGAVGHGSLSVQGSSRSRCRLGEGMVRRNMPSRPQGQGAVFPRTHRAHVAVAARRGRCHPAGLELALRRVDGALNGLVQVQQRPGQSRGAVVGVFGEIHL